MDELQIIYTYTRAQAIADGVQVDVTKTAQEAGIKFPVFLTRAVFDHYVTVPPSVAHCQDERGRLWDIVWMLRMAILHSQNKGGSAQRIPVVLYVQNVPTIAPQLVKLVAVAGPVDFDDPSPSITVMLPTED